MNTSRFFYYVRNLVMDTITRIWALRRENLSSEVCDNTGADQPAHPGSLISAFVIHLLESNICKLTTGEISIH